LRFMQVGLAWRVLKDETLRGIYLACGWDGLVKVRVRARVGVRVRFRVKVRVRVRVSIRVFGCSDFI